MGKIWQEFICVCKTLKKRIQSFCHVRFKGYVFRLGLGLELVLLGSGKGNIHRRHIIPYFN